MSLLLFKKKKSIESYKGRWKKRCFATLFAAPAVFLPQTIPNPIIYRLNKVKEKIKLRSFPQAMSRILHKLKKKKSHYSIIEAISS